MSGQARRSGLVMGLDTYMIVENRARSTSTPTPPTRPSPTRQARTMPRPCPSRGCASGTGRTAKYLWHRDVLFIRCTATDRPCEATIDGPTWSDGVSSLSWKRARRPILTMEPPGTAVRTTVSPGHARPSAPKLSVLFRRSYALSSKACLDRRGSQPSFAPDITSQVPLPHSTLASMIIASRGSALPSYPLT
jgi:hypothetical protein